MDMPQIVYVLGVRKILRVLLCPPKLGDISRMRKQSVPSHRFVAWLRGYVLHDHLHYSEPHCAVLIVCAVFCIMPTGLVVPICVLTPVCVVSLSVCLTMSLLVNSPVLSQTTTQLSSITLK